MSGLGYIIGDDSCQYSQDGVCDDGGEGAVPVTVGGEETFLCKYGTE